MLFFVLNGLNDCDIIVLILEYLLFSAAIAVSSHLFKETVAGYKRLKCQELT